MIKTAIYLTPTFMNFLPRAMQQMEAEKRAHCAETHSFMCQVDQAAPYMLVGGAAEEELLANLLRNEGHIVEEVQIVEGQRNPDRLVDGLKTEFKHMDPGATNVTVRNQVNESIKRGGQARNIVIDARGSGLTEAEANRGLNRVAGFQRGKLDSVRIIGDGFDISRKF